MGCGRGTTQKKVIRRVARLHEVLDTGPLHEQAVQLMSTYRSFAARMQNAKASTQGKLDRRLERLGKRIAERLGELTDQERMALSCWLDGKTPGTYEVDHAELMEQQYVSIRKVDRWTEEYDPADDVDDTDRKPDAAVSEQLQKFLRMGLD